MTRIYKHLILGGKDILRDPIIRNVKADAKNTQFSDPFPAFPLLEQNKIYMNEGYESSQVY